MDLYKEKCVIKIYAKKSRTNDVANFCQGQSFCNISLGYVCDLSLEGKGKGIKALVRGYN